MYSEPDHLVAPCTSACRPTLPQHPTGSVTAPASTSATTTARVTADGAAAAACAAATPAAIAAPAALAAHASHTPAITAPPAATSVTVLARRDCDVASTAPAPVPPQKRDRRSSPCHARQC